MNRARRSDVDRAVALIQEALQILGDARDAEQEAFDAMPESFQQGERGEAAQGWIDWLDGAVNDLENLEGGLPE